jgi:ribosomal protein S18 acetylase RimI-like enzyme
VFWETDPAGFVGVDRGGELAAAGAIVSYRGQFGFMGLFIVRPELRGRGLGRRLWFLRRDALLARLRRGAAIGMDGVFAMQDFYAAGGFRLSHRNLRMCGVGEPGPADPALRPLSAMPFAEVAPFDRLHFGVERAAFLRRWINPPGGLGLGLVEHGRVRGIGVARPCREGFKVGPLFAEEESCAERIFCGLGRAAAGEAVFLDVPENNPRALALAERHGMREVFGCARMYLGAPPPYPGGRSSA